MAIEAASGRLVAGSPVAACANCNRELVADWKYCPNCGQQASVRRLTLHHIGHDFLHATLHIDSSVLSLLRLLLFQPGVVARDYVSGKRKRYFGPFAFLVVVVALASLAVELSGFRAVYTETPNASADLLERFFDRHVNLLVFAQVPLLAAICRVLWFRQRFNYAEYLVLASYTSGMRVLLFIVLLIPASLALASKKDAIPLLYYSAYVPLWPLYFGFACSQFIPGSRIISALKGILTALLTHVIAVAITIGSVGLISQLIASRA